MRKYICLFVLFFFQLQATRGIVIAVCDRYVPDLLISLEFLRKEIKCKLPIEVWHAGDEISEKSIARLLQYDGVSIHDIVSVIDMPANHFRGFQIKGYLPQVSNFDEVIIMDADLIFYEDPEKLFHHEGYVRTGAFFFCDQESYNFFGYPRVSGRLYHGGLSSYYRARKALFTSLIKEPSSYFPDKWKIYWQENEPSTLNPFPSEHQESGCVVIDKKRHVEGLKNIQELNRRYKETYKYVWGDKETYWMGMEMANEPYHFNETIPCKVIDQVSGFLPFKVAKIRLMQIVDGKIFYQQKRPKKLSSKSSLLERSKERSTRKLNLEEVRLINLANQIEISV